MLLNICNTQFTIERYSELLFIQLGRLEICIQPTLHRPTGRGLGRFIEVWRKPEGIAGDGSYDSPHYFAFGKRIFWSVGVIDAIEGEQPCD